MCVNTLPPNAFPTHAWPESLGQRPLLMGIVNVTPDSFSDGGHFAAHEAALAHGLRLLDEGADIIDIGGESTRPGAAAVETSVELARVIPVIAALKAARPDLTLSIDTYKAATAHAALEAGARIVNDVWGLQRDAAMAETVAAFGAGLVIMHNRVEKSPQIDIVDEIERFFAISLASAAKAGIPLAHILLDPGVGFGKTLEQNLAAITAIPRLRRLGCRVLLGVSRKSFLGLITNRPVDERLAGTLAVGVHGVLAGVDVLRVHDVAPHRDALLVIRALQQHLPPPCPTRKEMR